MAVRLAHAAVQFAWPSALEAIPKLSGALPHLGQILGRPLPTPFMPSAPVAKAKVEKALREIAAASHNGDQVPIAINANAIKMEWMVERVPCLTKARAEQAGFWITSLGRFLTVDEMFRLQGIDPTRLRTRGISATSVARMIGNAFTQPAIERLLRQALPAAGLAPRAALRDRFA